MKGYAVTWCETDANGKRVKRREEYTETTHGWPLEGLHSEAKAQTGKLRRAGFAACVESIQ
jgi:hypothetical protein